MGRAAKVTQPTWWKEGERAVRIINKLKHTKGSVSGKPFRLRPWQEVIVRRIFGTLRADGLRQFRTIYIALPRKNGKSELAAAIAILLLMFDREEGAEVYSCAAERDQAALVFNVAHEMIDMDPVLRRQVKPVLSTKRLIYKKSRSVYKAVSAEAPSKHGLNPHGVIYDELHAAPSRELYDVMVSATGAREQPLMVIITTAGWDKKSICGEVHDYALRVRDGEVHDPTFLPVIYSFEPKKKQVSCGIDEKGKPIIRKLKRGESWKSRRVWGLCNPALGDFRRMDQLEAEFHKAVAVPAQQNTFRQLYLNEWTEQATRWLDMDSWRACGQDMAETTLAGRECYLGLDLSSKIDITAAVALFKATDDDPLMRVKCWFWMPEETLRRRALEDRVPYELWRAQGFIHTTPGNALDYSFIFDTIVNDIATMFEVQEVAFDPFNATQMAIRLGECGMRCVEVPQRIGRLSEPAKELEAMILRRKIAHDHNPVLEWMVGNVAVWQDKNGNYMPHKGKSTGRIDGVAALMNALARHLVAIDQPEPVWATQGLRFI